MLVFTFYDNSVDLETITGANIVISDSGVGAVYSDGENIQRGDMSIELPVSVSGKSREIEVKINHGAFADIWRKVSIVCVPLTDFMDIDLEPYIATPIAGEKPSKAELETFSSQHQEYTGYVTDWDGDFYNGEFDGGAVYTCTLKLTPASAYTFASSASQFTHGGAESITQTYNAMDGSITVVITFNPAPWGDFTPFALNTDDGTDGEFTI
jgi:hypothetical protein